MFFAETQNKMLYAVTEHTAAEIITMRADASKPNMGLTSWKGTIVRRGDIIVAKNYLTESEIDKLNRLTNLFLESAELRVKERKDLTLDFWRNNVSAMLSFQGQPLLTSNGSISNAKMTELVSKVYEDFDKKRKDFEAKLADQQDIQFLEIVEQKVKATKEDK